MDTLRHLEQLECVAAMQGCRGPAWSDEQREAPGCTGDQRRLLQILQARVMRAGVAAATGAALASLRRRSRASLT